MESEEVMAGVAGAAALTTLLMLVMGLIALAVLLRKAGISRRWLPLIFLVGPVAALVVVFMEWPIERELAWHRLKEGGELDRLVGQVEGYALDLERLGDWERAKLVYEELARLSPQNSTYYFNCIQRLDERVGVAG